MSTQEADVSGKVKTAGYKPLPHAWFAKPRDLPIFSHATVRAMLLDPDIRLNLRMRAAPIAGAFFGYKQGEKWVEGIQCKRPEVGAFVYRQLQRIWKTFLPGILRAQVWGWSAGEITLKLSENNLAEIDKLEPRHAGDCRLLLRGHKKYGVRFNRVEGHGHVDLEFPYCWFHSFDAEDGELYGTPNLLGAYSPWADKWFNGGGLDTRRLFMHKDAYGGRKLWYPEGTTYIDGVEVPNSDIARQIVEQLEAGGVATLPSTIGGDGEPLWRLEEPNVSSNPQHILQYPKDLDNEIRHGQEIPDDVISSDSASGGWAGKRIPLAAFYASLDSWIVQILCDLKEQVFDPLILLNWGQPCDYEIGHKPLAEQAMEQQSNAGPGDSSGGDSMFEGPFGNVERDGPTRMSIDPVDAVGRGVLSAAGIVNAARAALAINDGGEHA